MPGRPWAALAFALVLGSCAHAPVGAGDELLIQDVTLISPERPAPLDHADVLVLNGRIAQVGTGLVAGPRSRRIDGRGRFLIPGLIDSHVHVGFPGPVDDAALDSDPSLLAAYRAQLPRAFLAFGYTTLVDLDLSPRDRAWFEASPLRPRLYHCGRAVRIAGGYGAQRPPQTAAAAEAANLVHEPAQAELWPKALAPSDYTPARAVERVVAAGGICLKTFVEPGFGGAFHWPVPRPETMAALGTEARRHGLAFVVHANSAESWRAALDARADAIVHGLWHWRGDMMDAAPAVDAREVIAAVASARMGVQPTSQVLYGGQSMLDWSILDDPRLAVAFPRKVIAYLRGDSAQVARRALADQYRGAVAGLFAPASPPDLADVLAVGPRRVDATLRLMVDQHVRLLFGTDTPANEGPANPPGLNGRIEMQRWADAGVPPALILRAATLDNAEVFGLSKELGSIEVGKRADLLLLRANPLDTVAAYDAIETVFLNGEPIQPADLRPAD